MCRWVVQQISPCYTYNHLHLITIQIKTLRCWLCHTEVWGMSIYRKMSLICIVLVFWLISQYRAYWEKCDVMGVLRSLKKGVNIFRKSISRYKVSACMEQNITDIGGGGELDQNWIGIPGCLCSVLSPGDMQNVMENFLFIICNLISITNYVLNNANRDSPSQVFIYL